VGGVDRGIARVIGMFASRLKQNLRAHAPTMNRIALVMIARDEARCIERCLVSARAWVDEMWVLDTGSADATVQIAERRGARVAQFGWVDDFAAARNAAMALTDADWCLVLDADEWLVHGGEALAALRTQTPAFIGQISVASSFDAERDSVGEAPSWLPRVLPRGVRYEGRVHEQPQSALPRRRLPVLVGHDGYLGAQMAHKQGRNEHLLQLALAAQPEDAYLRYQLGKDFEVRAEFDAAAPHYLQALAQVVAARPRAAHALHAEEARPFRIGGHAGGRRDATLQRVPRLLLRARRPAAGLGRECAGARCRAVADDRVELAACHRDRRAT
jgi:Glycosyl transferase family 2